MTKEYIVKIEMPDGDDVSSIYLRDIIQAYCDVEDKGRWKVLVKEQQHLIDKACKTYCDLICKKGMCGMCYHKHDNNGQIKNDFKYNECNELQLIRRELEIN